MSRSTPSSGQASIARQATSPWLQRLAWAGMILATLLLGAGVWWQYSARPAPTQAPPAVSIQDRLPVIEALHAWQAGLAIPAPVWPKDASLAPLAKAWEDQIQHVTQWQAVPVRQELLGMLDKVVADSQPWWQQTAARNEVGPQVAAWSALLPRVQYIRDTLAGPDWLRQSNVIRAHRTEIERAMQAFAGSVEATQATALNQTWRAGIAAWFAAPDAWTRLDGAIQTWQQGAADRQTLVQGLSRTAPASVPVSSSRSSGPLWMIVVAWLAMMASVVLLLRQSLLGRGQTEAIPLDTVQGHLDMLQDDVQRIRAGELNHAFSHQPTALHGLVDQLDALVEDWRARVETNKALGTAIYDKTCDIGELNGSTMEHVKAQDGVLASVGQWVVRLRQRGIRAEGQVAEMMKQLNVLVSQGMESVRHGQKARKGALETQRHATESTKPIQMVLQDAGELKAIMQTLQDLIEHVSVLAMQASLQAAKAGDAGRGFQVVAKEVQEIAQRAESAIDRGRNLVESDLTNLGAIEQALASIREHADDSIKWSERADEASEGMEQGLGGVKTLAQEIEGLVATQSQDAQTAQDELAGAPSSEMVTAQDSQNGQLVFDLTDLARQIGENLSKFHTGRSA